MTKLVWSKWLELALFFFAKHEKRTWPITYIWNCWQLHILAPNVILNINTFPCCNRKIYCFSSIIRKLHILRNIMYHMYHNTYLRLYMYIYIHAGSLRIWYSTMIWECMSTSKWNPSSQHMSSRHIDLMSGGEFLL